MGEMNQWYCHIGGQQYGPVGEDVLRRWAAEGRLTSADPVWREGMADWALAGAVLMNMPAAWAAAAAVPASPPLPFMGSPAWAPPKSKIAAGILGILLGMFGVHNFYLGYTGRGVAQLLLTVLTCGFGIVPAWIWGLIEGIQILTGAINTDAQGRPLGP